MFIKIPFESEIEFKTNISEITKMSLEHDYNVNDEVVLGNFYISGEYRSHPVSINTDPFNYTLPFTVELHDNIKKDTLEFNIEDFTYDIKDDNKLKVNIEYSLKAEVEEPKKEILDNFERVDENDLSNELEYIDSFLENNDKKGEDNSNEEIKEDDGRIEKEVECKEEEINRDLNLEEKKIMDTIKDSDDTFVTYHVHIVSADENIESICKKYNISSSLLEEYNSNINNISAGDKIIIPEVDE